MPTLAELLQLQNNPDSYVGYPQLQRQAARMRLAQQGRNAETLPDPRTYGFVRGLLGTTPDELGMSVLSPNTAAAKEAAYYGNQLSNLAQIAPAMMPATKVALRSAGGAINDAMVYGTGPLATLTPQPMRVVPTEVAKRIDMPTNLPKTPEFMEAIANEPSAQITNEGLLINLKRLQNPAQSGEESVRTGVFYLPEGQAGNLKHYKGKTGYGGSEPIEGQTLYKNPLLVKGATGGKAPEVAYDHIVGKGAYQTMRKDVLNAYGYNANQSQKIEAVQGLLEKYNGLDSDDAYNMAYNIVTNSKGGNLLPYAVQENIVGHAVRNAGHDAVLGYSKGKGDKGHFFSEVFDVRESHYPTSQGDYQLMPQFERKIK